jgi:hypothetical protein
MGRSRKTNNETIAKGRLARVIDWARVKAMQKATGPDSETLYMIL